MTLRVEVIAGRGAIGGNCVAVFLNDDEYLLLDHGLRFDKYRKYYGLHIQPLGADELRELGILPPFEAVASSKAVLISHLHLDHLGSLDYLDVLEDEGPQAYLPLRDYYSEVLAERWRYSWKSVLVPHLSTSKRRIKSVEEGARFFTPVKVYHSACPSYSYVIETSSGIVVYTGDFRLKSLIACMRGEETLLGEAYAQLYGDPEYGPLERLREVAEKPDILVAEGTNFGRLITPLEPGDFAKIIERILSRTVAIVSLHTLDLESLLAIAAIARRLGLTTSA